MLTTLFVAGALAAGATAQPIDAQSILDAARNAYQAAPGLSDAINYRVILPGSGEDEGRYTFTLAAGKDIVLDIAPVSAASVGDTVYITSALSPGAYFETPIDNDIYATLQALLPNGAPPRLPQAMLRWGAPDDEVVSAFGFGLFEPTGTGEARVVVSDDGQSLHELKILGDAGEAIARFDAESGLLVSMTVQATPPGAPPEVVIVADAQFEPKVLTSEQAAAPFTIADKERVYTLSSLLGATAQAGDPLPDLALTLADGAELRLADFQGQTLVLEFWSSWCALCRVTLPAVQRVADEQADDDSVAFLAVNTLETRDDASMRRAVDSWKTMGATSLPVAYDSADALAAALGIESLPVTMIVDANGVIVAVLNRDTTDLAQALRDSIATAKSQ